MNSFLVSFLIMQARAANWLDKFKSKYIIRKELHVAIFARSFAYAAWSHALSQVIYISVLAACKKVNTCGQNGSRASLNTECKK